MAWSSQQSFPKAAGPSPGHGSWRAHAMVGSCACVAAGEDSNLSGAGAAVRKLWSPSPHVPGQTKLLP